MNALALIAKNAKRIVATVVVLVILYTVWKNWDKISRFMRRDRGRGDQQGSVSDTRKAELEAMARRLYADIYSSWWTSRDADIYTATVQLNDNELEYLARFYEQTVTSGVPLGRDIDGEIYGPTSGVGDAPDRIVARLRQLALF